MRLLFFLAVWKRPDITEICFMGLQRLRRAGLFQFDSLAVISEKSMIPLCRKYDIDYCHHNNLPLGQKKNFGLNRAMKKTWDYVVELGSDDLIKTEAFEVYSKFWGEEVFGMNHFAWLNSETGECVASRSNKIFGLGRCISRSVIEKHKMVKCETLKSFITQRGYFITDTETGKRHVFFRKEIAEEMHGLVNIVSDEKYFLWPETINRALDNHSNYQLRMSGFTHKIIDMEKPMGIDIKSKENIWPFSPSVGKQYDMKKLMEGLSQEEQSAIASLIKRNQCIETQVIR